MTSRAHFNPDHRRPGLAIGEDAAAYWQLRVLDGSAYHCPDCGGVRITGEQGQHCTPATRERMRFAFKERSR